MTSVGTLRSPLEAALVGRLIERPPTSARLPVGALTREEKAAELVRLQVRKAMDTAYEAELVMGLADDTPDALDPPPDHPGAERASWAPDTELPGVSQFSTPELAMVLDCGRGTAPHVAHRAWTYRESLPATWAALTERALDEPRAEVLADVLPLAYDGPPRGLCDGPPRPRFARTSCQRRLRPAVTHRPAAAVGPRQPPRRHAVGRAGRRGLRPPSGPTWPAARSSTRQGVSPGPRNDGLQDPLM